MITITNLINNYFKKKQPPRTSKPYDIYTKPIDDDLENNIKSIHVVITNPDTIFSNKKNTC
jgi:hypothetical protein